MICKLEEGKDKQSYWTRSPWN